MPDFGELMNKAKQLASEHPDQVVKGVEKLEEFVDKKTGGQYGNQIESAGHMVENYLGTQEQGQQAQPGQQAQQSQPGQQAQRGEGGQQSAQNNQ